MRTYWNARAAIRSVGRHLNQRGEVSTQPTPPLGQDLSTSRRSTQEDNLLAQRPLRQRIARHLPALAVLVILSLILTWPLARDMRHVLYSWGDPVFQAWTMAWNWHALTTDPANIFNANVFYPWRNTLAYSDHLFGQTLLVLPVLAVTGEGILADNISVLLAFILSGFAMYLLVVDMTGNRVAALLAGVAYAFAPSRMAHLEHLHLLSMQWPPLLLLCLRRVTLSTGVARRWWAGGLAAAFFIQGLSGVYFLYFSVVMLLIAGGVYVLIAVLDRDRQLAQSIALAGGACALAGALLIPTLWPYQQVHDDLGVEREVSEVSYWSATRGDYLAVWPDNRLYNEILDENFRHIEQALFPGLAIVVLGVVGMTHSRFRREKWVLLAIVVSSIVLSFGLTGTIFGREVPLPYRIFYEGLPGFRAIRVPARFGLVALIGMGGLAGLGVDRLWRDARRRIPSRQQFAAGAAALVLGLAVLGLESLTIMELPDPLPVDEPPPAYAWMADHPVPTIELPMTLDLNSPVASAWPNFWSMMHWNDLANGYSGLVPPTYLMMRERMTEFPAPETISLLQGIGIETVVIHGDFPESDRSTVEAELEANPSVSLALAGPDAVYQLDRDPWMWRLVDAVPDGEPVSLPNIDPDPLAFGYLVAILQRQGHEVSGNGTVDYLELQPATDACYAILKGDDDPAGHGYLGAAMLIAESGYTLYRAAGCD